MQISNLFKQKECKKLGAFFNLLYLCLPILSIFSAIGVGLTTYATFVVDYMPWLPLWVYLVAVVVAAGLVMVLFWVFVYKGYFMNPIGQDVAKIKAKLGIED